jgi:hypothetical protein
MVSQTQRNFFNLWICMAFGKTYQLDMVSQTQQASPTHGLAGCFA